MKQAPLPQHEAERLQTLLDYRILDTTSESSFDDITELASAICGTKIAAISLIDKNRQWFKSTTGLDKSVTETPRDIALCAHAIHQTEVFTVSDATQDDRFFDNPLVTGLGVRFYAGATLIAPNGHAIGTLCVIDDAPKSLSDEQKQSLKTLARQVMAQIELREAHRQLAKRFEELQASTKLVTMYQEKLAESSRLVSLAEMSSGIAHEINNPLAIVAGRAELLLEKFESRGSLHVDEAKNDLNIILKTCRRMATIITSLRTFSQDSTNEIPKASSIGEVVEDTLSLCAARFREKKIDLRLEIENVQLSCRPVQISQILLNLLNNAYDATAESQERWISISTHKMNNGVVLSVTDSGLGLSKAVAAKIMQPFFTTKDVGKGMGLGLSISTGLAKTNNGSLSLDASSPNTKFDLFLPNLAA